MAFFHWVTGNFLLYQTVSGGFLLCSARNKASLVGILIFICRGNHNFEIFVFLFRLKLKFMYFEECMVAFTNKWSNLKIFKGKVVKDDQVVCFELNWKKDYTSKGRTVEKHLKKKKSEMRSIRYVVVKNCFFFFVQYNRTFSFSVLKNFLIDFLFILLQIGNNKCDKKMRLDIVFILHELCV